MACPFFEPVARMDPGEWIHAPRLPLIDLFRGLCRASEPFEPEPPVQRDLCNWGCAGSKCERFSGDGPDAVRFSMVDGRIVYVFEKQCAPVSHGIADGTESGILAAQIRAFEQSYLQSSRGGEKVSTATESSSTSAE